MTLVLLRLVPTKEPRILPVISVTKMGKILIKSFFGMVDGRRGCYLGMSGRGLSTRLPTDSEAQKKLLPGHKRPWSLYEAAN